MEQSRKKVFSKGTQKISYLYFHKQETFPIHALDRKQRLVNFSVESHLEIFFALILDTVLY